MWLPAFSSIFCSLKLLSWRCQILLFHVSVLRVYWRCSLIFTSVEMKCTMKFSQMTHMYPAHMGFWRLQRFHPGIQAAVLLGPFTLTLPRYENNQKHLLARGIKACWEKTVWRARQGKERQREKGLLSTVVSVSAWEMGGEHTLGHTHTHLYRFLCTSRSWIPKPVCCCIMGIHLSHCFSGMWWRSKNLFWAILHKFHLKNWIHRIQLKILQFDKMRSYEDRDNEEHKLHLWQKR